MRPAQLRRFAAHDWTLCRGAKSGFNEAGAAAPVCQDIGGKSRAKERRFNEAGAAAPVCQFALIQRAVSVRELQ